MSAYLLGVIGTILLCVILTAILPEGKSSGIIKSVARMACILAIVAPILNYIQSGRMDFSIKQEENFSKTVIEQDEGYIKYYSELRVHETEALLAEEVQARYGVLADVTLFWEHVDEVYGNYTIKQIEIQAIRVCIDGVLTEAGRQEMYEYLTKNYCSEVLIE